MPKQKILFEAGPMLDARKNGVGYYVEYLVSSLQAQYSDRLSLIGYYFNFLNRHPETTSPYDGLSFLKIWLIPGRLISLCRRLGFQPWLELFVRQRAGTIIFTNYVSLPQLSKRKTVLVIYDLSYLDAPEFTQAVNLRYLKRFCSPSIKRADVIITISEYTKQRLAYHFPNVKARVVVTPIPPVSRQARQYALEHSLTEKGIKKGGYILYVGTIEPRKNLGALLTAYSLLDPAIRANLSVVLAGGKGWKDKGILRAIDEQRSQGLNIIQTGYVSDQEKNSLYSNAACFVLPSHYEGFGMPILEAMQHGAACAVSDIPVFHEVAGEAAVYFDKDSPADMAEKITSILENQTLKSALVQKSEAQLQKFSWEENARTVYQALQ